MARKTGSHSDITGPRIQAVALRLFAQHGYAAVSMRQIAGEVGVQAGALYNYTRDKQSLLFQLLMQHMEDLLAGIDALNLGDMDPADALDAFVTFHILHHVERTDSLFVSYMELRSLEPDNFAAIQTQRDRYEGGLEALLTAGRKSGAFAIEDPKLATKAMIPMLNGISYWFRAGGRLDIDAVTAHYRQMSRRLVGAGDAD